MEAETQDHLQFTVRLWSSSEAPQSVIVEMQRIDGCCFLYHQMCRKVFEAATASAASMSTNKPRAFPMPKCIPQETPEQREQCTKEGLDIASSLLQTNRIDAHLMALESLVRLTGSCNCSQEARKFAAREILQQTEAQQERSLLDTVLCLIQSFRMDSQDDSALTDMEEQHFSIMHRNALTVLANCLEECSPVEDCALSSELVSESLLTSLVQDMADSEKRPHDACQSVRCLSALSASTECQQKLQQLLAGKDALSSVVLQAQRAGRSRHEQLRAEAEKLQQRMQL